MSASTLSTKFSLHNNSSTVCIVLGHDEDQMDHDLGKAEFCKVRERRSAAMQRKASPLGVECGHELLSSRVDGG